MSLNRLCAAACLFLGIAYLFVSSPREENAAHVFSSPVYPYYRQQLQKFFSSHSLHEQVSCAPPTPFNSVIQRLMDDRSEARHQHASFVADLRKLAVQRLASKPLPEEKASFQLLDDLIRWLFLQADLGQAYQSYLYQFVSVPADLKELPELLGILRAHPLFSGLHSPLNKDEGFLHGNLPSRICEVHKTQLIRLALPVHEARWGFRSPAPNPEFLLFLHLQPKHLYVNVMKRQGEEAKSSHAIEKLEREFPSLYVVTLDKNSSFYWQDESHYPESMPAKEFGELFLASMLSKNGAYYWSSHLEPQTWKKELRKIIWEVYQSRFTPQEKLTRSERCDWIELTYVALLDHLVEKWRPSSMNITCRRAIDRAPSLSLLWLWKQKSADPGEIAAHLLAPSLLFHNRTIHKSRVDRLISAALRLDKKQ
jgi:hypothetical protein